MVYEFLGLLVESYGTWSLLQRLDDASKDSDIPKNVPFAFAINNRNIKCPIKPLMHGEATPKRRATNSSDTMEVRAHAAHLDDADSVCACCADQPSKRVQWSTGPWPTLRGSATEPSSNRSVLKSASDDSSSGGRHVAKGERTATASAQPPTQGEF